jgi:hypothetical protein
MTVDTTYRMVITGLWTANGLKSSCSDVVAEKKGKSIEK